MKPLSLRFEAFSQEVLLLKWQIKAPLYPCCILVEGDATLSYIFNVYISTAIAQNTDIAHNDHDLN